MNNNNTCPVCGNQGIPAYHKENVICPRCGSDLRIYKSLSDVADVSSKSEKANKIYKRLAILFPIIVFVICGIPTYYFYKGQSKINNTISDNNIEIAQLKDSIATLTHLIQLKETKLNTKKESQAYSEYVILHNDSPWSIVKRFYGIRGDWKELAKQIAVDNQIWDDAKAEWKQIYPGQVIKIYNRK